MPKSDTNRPTIEVRTWPGIVICSALHMVLSVDELPGIGEDFESMARVINPTLTESILLFLLTNMPAVLTDLSLQEHVADLAPEDFLHWVEGLNTSDLAERACKLADEETDSWHETVQSPESPEAENPIEWLRAGASEAQLRKVHGLLKDPVALQAMAAEVLRIFWANHFRALYVRHSDAMARAVTELGRYEELDALLPLLERLLGRSIQLPADSINNLDRILLVPFPFMGPYLMSMSMEEPVSLLLLAFDAKRAMSRHDSCCTGPDVSKLKALADETRLKILQFVSESEQFGGDIVTYLGISQPGVSRHLRLLKASGLLAVRQEGTSKFYSLCDAEFDALAEGIRQMKSDTKDSKKEGKQ